MADGGNEGEVVGGMEGYWQARVAVGKVVVGVRPKRVSEEMEEMEEAGSERRKLEFLGGEVEGREEARGEKGEEGEGKDEER